MSATGNVRLQVIERDTFNIEPGGETKSIALATFDPHLVNDFDMTTGGCQHNFDRMLGRQARDLREDATTGTA